MTFRGSIIAIALSGCIWAGCGSLRHERADEEGTVWSEVREERIRVLETGIRTDATDGSRTIALIVFDNDSTRAELFFSDNRPGEIMTRRSHTNGEPEWGRCGQDGTAVYRDKGIWTIGQRHECTFRQPAEETDPALGDLRIRSYGGTLPTASGIGMRCLLTIRHRQYSGDGLFMLTASYSDENGQRQSSEYIGRRYTLRGTADNEDATVWQLRSGAGAVFNFLYDSAEETLTLLNDNFEQVGTACGHTLHPTE